MAQISENKPKTGRGRRSTKVDMQQDFEQILQTHMDAKASENSKVDERVLAKEDEVRQEVKDVSSEEVARKFANFSIELSRTLSCLSEKLVGEIDLLAKVRQAVDIEKREIEQLHKIDVARNTLDNLLEEYSTKKSELEAEIAAQHDQWEQEQYQREAENKEYEESLAKTRKRESEEFEYKRMQERKKAQDKYEEEMRIRERQNRETQEALEKSWQAKEASHKAQEEEFTSLKTSVESFPTRLQNEVQQAIRETENRVKQQLEQDLLLNKRDAESERKISELKIQTLQDTISQQSLQISKLQTQLDEAKKQVQDIAVKAIEGASGAKTLSHINQIAMEQAKGRTNQIQ